MYGWADEATYSCGEQSAGRQYGDAVGYSNGNLNARLVYNNHNSDNALPGATPVSHGLGHNTLLVAS